MYAHNTHYWCMKLSHSFGKINDYTAEPLLKNPSNLMTQKKNLTKILVLTGVTYFFISDRKKLVL